MVTADLHFTHTDEYEKQSKTSYKLFKIKKIFSMKKFYFFYKIGKAAGNILMKYKMKDVLDDQILKT